jgi:hypothetical protein
MDPIIEDIDNQLRPMSLMWSALHSHGRERREEKEALKQIDDLLDYRLELMAKERNEVRPEVSKRPVDPR